MQTSTSSFKLLNPKGSLNKVMRINAERDQLKNKLHKIVVRGQTLLELLKQTAKK